MDSRHSSGWAQQKKPKMLVYSGTNVSVFKVSPSLSGQNRLDLPDVTPTWRLSITVETAGESLQRNLSRGDRGS